MRRITGNTYHKKDLTEEWLRENNFHYSNTFSTADEKAYYYQFPVYKYGIQILLVAEIVVYATTHDVTVNIYNNKDHSRASEFYTNSIIYDSFVRKVEKKILREMKKIGIVKKKKGD